MDPAAQGPAPAAAGPCLPGLGVRAALFAVLILCAFAARAQQAPYDKPQGIYATINMSGTDSAIRQLGQLIPYERRAAISNAVPAAPRLSPPALYALANAISLDDSGMENAVVWYHIARVRAVYDGLRCKDASARNAVNILGKGLNPDIARFQRQNRKRTLELAQVALRWDLENPRAYDYRWINLWGKVARYSAGTDPNELTVPESEWPAILRHVHEAHLKSVHDFATQK
jgi:hypothetical protein